MRGVVLAVSLAVLATAACDASAGKPRATPTSPVTSSARQPRPRAVATVPTCRPQQLRAALVGDLATYQVNLINMDPVRQCVLEGRPLALLGVTSTGAVVPLRPRLYVTGTHRGPTLLRERNVTAATPWIAITLRGAQLQVGVIPGLQCKDFHFGYGNGQEQASGQQYTELRLVMPGGTIRAPFDDRNPNAVPFKFVVGCGFEMSTFEPPTPFRWQAPAV